MNPYRLLRLLAFIVAAACSVTALALVFGERADIEGMRFDDHPVLLLVSIVGALIAVPLCPTGSCPARHSQAAEGRS